MDHLGSSGYKSFIEKASLIAKSYTSDRKGGGAKMNSTICLKPIAQGTGYYLVHDGCNCPAFYDHNRSKIDIRDFLPWPPIMTQPVRACSLRKGG